MKKYISAPDIWIAIFSIAGLFGVCFSIAGLALKLKWLTIIGVILIAPIVVLGGLLLLIGIPILIIINRKNEKSSAKIDD